MGVVRWIYPQFMSTRAEKLFRDYREIMWDGSHTNHGYAENGDPLHLGEGPPR
jgi:hypothetical protein